MYGTVVIDCFPDSVRHYREGYTVVAIDIIRATTTAITAVAMGRQCFPVPSLEAAMLLKAELKDALLVGELGGEMPDGFDMSNSPAELALRTDVSRPLILLSSTGTALVCEAGKCDVAYLACFRNYASVARHLAGRYRKIAIIGAGSRGEFREEDQMCCAWIAEALTKAGYEPQDNRTIEIIDRWSGAPPDAFAGGASVEYLRRSGQLKDLQFILAHINDLNDAFLVENNEIVVASEEKQSRYLRDFEPSEIIRE
jgi:2-phosphosulfolactate phosphatase